MRPSSHMLRLIAVGLLVGVAALLALSAPAWADSGKGQGHSTVPRKEADLSIAKRGEQTGKDDVTWYITVKNNGPIVAEKVVVTDKYGPHMDLEQITTTQGSCNPDERKRQVVCDLGNLTVGQEVTITIETDIEPDNFKGNITNHAKVDSKTKDPKKNNNQVTAKINFRGK